MDHALLAFVHAIRVLFLNMHYCNCLEGCASEYPYLSHGSVEGMAATEPTQGLHASRHFNIPLRPKPDSPAS
jgi:hypothetical protein